MSKMTTPKTLNRLLLLATMLALVDCTKDGDTIYQINPDEEKPSTASCSYQSRASLLFS